MSSSKNILLISYVFPPYPGIGGRRWAKFAKYLSKKGYTVHVICAKNPFSEISLWIDDIQAENIQTYNLPLFYPKILITQPQNIFQKIHYKLAERSIKIFKKGTPYDRAIFSEKSILKKSLELVNKYHINTVIATGAPFRLNFYAVKLKEKLPHLHIINDFRDPWTWGHIYGFPTLAPDKMEYEKKMEKAVLEKSDIITVPVDVMMDYLIRTYPENKNKIVKLPHAFDEDEVKPLKKTISEKARLLFYGTIYNGIGKEFLSVSESLKKTDSSLTIISSSDAYNDIFFNNGTLNKNVFFKKNLEPKKLFSDFKNYDFILMIHYKEIAEYVSTKFYEIIYSNTPIIFIGPSGRTAQFITDNGIGFHILPDKIEQELPEILNNKKICSLNLKFNITDYSFASQTESLIKLLK